MNNNQTYPKNSEANPMDLSSARPIIVQPVIQHVMPAPQAKTQDAQATWAKRTKITAIIFMVVGAISLFQCMGIWMNAKKLSLKILTGNWHNTPMKLEDYIDRDEFSFYDIMKNVAITSCFFSMFTFGIGKVAHCALKKEDKEFATKAFRCSVMKTLICVAIYMYTKNLGKDGRTVVESYRERHPNIHYAESAKTW